MSRFEDKLILSHWMLAQFGAETLEAMGNTLSADHLIGFDEENSSKLALPQMEWVDYRNPLLDYPPSSAARQPNLVASNPADIGKPGFLNDANQG